MGQAIKSAPRATGEAVVAGEAAVPDQLPAQATAGVRVVLAVLVGALAGAVAYPAYQSNAQFVTDFDQLRLAGQALLRGQNPYEALPQPAWTFPLLYPGPAVLLALPLAWLPPALARAGFAAAAAGFLAFALSRTPWRLLTLLSASALIAIFGGQWSPLFLAAWFVPSIGAVAAAKPNLGLAYFAARPSRAAFVGTCLLIAASLALMPSWPIDWWHALQGRTVQRAPILQPFGVILALAALKWRRPEARLLLTLAMIPQTIATYETLLLFAIPETRRELLLLAGLSYGAVYAQFKLVPQGALEQMTADRWPILLVLLWLPALAMVLRRPNEDRRYIMASDCESESANSSPATDLQPAARHVEAECWPNH
ncbi:MAG TPA: hypothetical protein VFS11_01375 [Gemmatimonadales bacterium]|nr:hypothetical protein [Gemmatimonadales bacterium]